MFLLPIKIYLLNIPPQGTKRELALQIQVTNHLVSIIRRACALLKI